MSTPDSTPSPDPIAGLHHMSTTAGVASSEYVAINNTAIVAAALGLATSLALIAPPFAVIGLAGVICGIIAFRQVQNSNGTQSGKGIAVLGVLLSVGFAGAVTASHFAERFQQREEERQINVIIQQLGERIVAGDYKAAYDLFDPDFKVEFKSEAFESKWRGQQSPDFAGRLLQMRGNNLFEFSLDGEGTQYALTQSVIRFEKAQSDIRVMTLLRKSDNQWRIRTFGLFQVEQPRPQRSPEIRPGA